MSQGYILTGSLPSGVLQCWPEPDLARPQDLIKKAPSALMVPRPCPQRALLPDVICLECTGGAVLQGASKSAKCQSSTRCWFRMRFLAPLKQKFFFFSLKFWLLACYLRKFMLLPGKQQCLTPRTWKMRKAELNTQ